MQVFTPQEAFSVYVEMLAYSLVDPLFIPYLTKAAPMSNSNTPRKNNVTAASNVYNSHNNNSINSSSSSRYDNINNSNSCNSVSSVDKRTKENHYKFLQASNQIESILCVYRESALGSSAWGAGEFVESLQCRPFYTSTVCVS